MRIHFVSDVDLEGSLFCPPLGIGSLSSYIKKEIPGVTTSVGYFDEDLEAAIRSHRPDIVGFSATSRYFLQQKEKARRVHETFGLPILWGGVHISIVPSDLPASASVGVIGEGETTLVELLRNYRNGAFLGLENIRGIVYRKDGELVRTPPRPYIENIDDIPPPDLEVLVVSWNRGRRGVIITSRGCPCKCRFCSSSRYWDRTRLHSPDYVIAEMRRIVDRYNVRELLVYDDFFTIRRDRIREIADRKTKDPKLRNVRIECLSRADAFNEELARDLKRMGVYRISFGIESGCQKTLNYLKNQTLSIATATRAILVAKKYGFERVASFIIGAPYETEEEIEETLAYIRTLPLDSVQISVATPFPGTELWEDGKRIGKIRTDTWSDEYYTLFTMPHGVDPATFLVGKILLTPIERERFVMLLRKAAEIVDSVNYRKTHLVRLFLRSLRDDPLGTPTKVIRFLRQILPKPGISSS